MRLALKDASMRTVPGNLISGADLEGLSREYLDVKATVVRLSRRYDSAVLWSLVNLKPQTVAGFRQPEQAAAFAAALQGYLQQHHNGVVRYEVRVIAEEGAPASVHVTRTQHGLDVEVSLEEAFFSSNEYRSISAFGGRLRELTGDQQSIKVMRGEREHTATDFGSALDWLLEQAKRGVTLQRYKGLGEMNPDQLWETTMDPQQRRLLRVAVEDDVSSDDTFTVLMGDQVEPRRDFIEKNAFSVSNLDV